MQARCVDLRNGLYYMSTTTVQVLSLHSFTKKQTKKQVKKQSIHCKLALQIRMTNFQGIVPDDRFIVKLGVATLKHLFNCSTAIVIQGIYYPGDIFSRGYEKEAALHRGYIISGVYLYYPMGYYYPGAILPRCNNSQCYKVLARLSR